MVDGFCTVAVRVEKEPSVVGLAVLGPGSRLAVAGIARRGACVPELVHVLPGRCRESDVQPPRERRILEDEELVRAPRCPALAVVLRDAEGLENDPVELL